MIDSTKIPGLTPLAMIKRTVPFSRLYQFYVIFIQVIFWVANLEQLIDCYRRVGEGVSAKG
jgi:hypothetical protein